MLLRKIFLPSFIVLLFSSVDGFGQYYSSAVGVRLGNASGITGKVLMGKKTYLEGILTARWDGFNITGLIEIVQPFPDTPGLTWYYGAGANIGIWDDPGDMSVDADLNVGADFIIGMDYTFEDVPINLSIDWKPYFIVLTNPRFEFDEFALSVRYTIHKR